MKQEPDVWTRTRIGFIDLTEQFRLTRISVGKPVKMVNSEDMWSTLSMYNNPVSY